MNSKMRWEGDSVNIGIACLQYLCCQHNQNPCSGHIRPQQGIFFWKAFMTYLINLSRAWIVNVFFLMPNFKQYKISQNKY